MNWAEIAFQVIGGLGLFLMGMKIMSETMQKVAGDRLRKTLNFLTSNRVMAIGVGLLVTGVIQSSSATTVMVVGFVNASLMTLNQAIGVILGANIGTTITGWLVTLSIVKYALPIIGLGVFIRFFSKDEKWHHYGEIIFGFGLLFLGMETMSAGLAPLRNSPGFLNFFTHVDGSSYLSIFIGVFIGALTTLIIQSSSATIGITIVLASQGLINYEGAVSLVLGENIGTTITAILASIGGNYHAKRAAIAHTLFNVLGVCFVMIVFFPFVRLVDAIVPGMASMTVETTADAAKYGVEIGMRPFIGQHIAMAHSLFNITNVIIFSFLIPMLARMCEFLIPNPREVEPEFNTGEFSHIGSSRIEIPSLAIAETEKRLIIMAEKVAKNALIVQDIITSKNGQPDLCDDVLEAEKNIDETQKYITEFLVSISRGAVSESDAVHIGNYMTLAHNLEKFADHVEHIALLYDKIERHKLFLSDEARQEIEVIYKDNLAFFNVSFNALTEEVNAQEFMNKTQVHNLRIKKLIKDAKISHFDRIRKKICRNEAAVHFMDLVNRLDGMRSEAYNIAEVTTGTKYRAIEI